MLEERRQHGQVLVHTGQVRKGQIPRKAHGLVVFRIAEGPTCDFQAARRTSLKCGNVTVESSPVRGLFSSRQQLPGSRKCPPPHTHKERGVGSSHLKVGSAHQEGIPEAAGHRTSLCVTGRHCVLHPLEPGVGPGAGACSTSPLCNLLGPEEVTATGLTL